MNYGRFFEYDFESSCLEKGIAIFKYRWLEHKMPDDDMNTPRHPIYISFTPESISFNLHYLEKNKQEKVEEAKEGPKWIHYHNTIIKLYLSSNTTDKLTEILNNIYWATFPLGIDSQLQEDIADSFDAQNNYEDGFSNFTCFEPESKENYSNNNSNFNTHFLRKIILDFLYDYEFTDVFKIIPYYASVSIKLRESFLFCALMNKTRYYYYRLVLSKREVIEPCLIDKDNRNKGTEDIERNMRSFVELYVKYEQDWLNSILDKRSMQFFHESPWFEESNVELEQVYWSRRKGKWNITEGIGLRAIKNIEEIDEVPELNKKARSASNRIKYLHKIGADKDSFALTVEDAIELIKMSSHSKEPKALGNAIKVHNNITYSTAKWEIVHYHFLGILKMWSGNIPILMWSLILLIPVLLLAFWGLWNITHCSVMKDVLYLVFVISCFFSIFGYRRFMRGVFRQTWGNGYWNLLMPHLFAAVVAAWFTMSMSADLFNHFALKSNPFSFSTAAILFMITFLFIVYESRQLNPYDKSVYNIFSALFVIGIAYFYSIVVGLMVFDYFGEPMINHIKISEISLRKLSTDTLNKSIAFKKEFIIQFSFFATFIGIFLQLMFKGKPVTDSNN